MSKSMNESKVSDVEYVLHQLDSGQITESDAIIKIRTAVSMQNYPHIKYVAYLDKHKTAKHTMYPECSVFVTCLAYDDEAAAAIFREFLQKTPIYGQHVAFNGDSTWFLDHDAAMKRWDYTLSSNQIIPLNVTNYIGLKPL